MLVAFEVAVELVGELRPVVEQMRNYDSNLADEIRQAALRTIVHLAEGQRPMGNRRRAFALAQDELCVIRDGLDQALRWGYVADASRAQRRVERLTGLCWGRDPAPHARAA